MWYDDYTWYMAKISGTPVVASKYTHVINSFPDYFLSQTDQSATFCEDSLTHPVSMSLCLSLSLSLSLGANMSSPGKETWGFKFHNSPASPIILCVCACLCARTLSHFISCLGFSGLHTAEKGLYYDYHPQRYSEIIIWFHTHTHRRTVATHTATLAWNHLQKCVVHAQTGQQSRQYDLSHTCWCHIYVESFAWPQVQLCCLQFGCRAECSM